MSVPPSCPPANQSTATGAPFAATACAIRSPWSSGNSESCCPCTTSVGALSCAATEDGLAAASIATASGSACPAVATRSYIRHSDSRNRPHPACSSSTGFASPPARGAPPDGPRPPAEPGATEPVVKKIPAHSFLNTPSAAPEPCTPCGNSESARFHQVIWVATASIRWSAAEASSETAPPYEAPVMPTFGSPGPSSCTSGRWASQSTRWRTSSTSRSGALRPILPPERPNPRADQVSTAYPCRASCSARSRSPSLEPPKPCASSTAGRGLPPVVKNEVSSWTCSALPGVSGMLRKRSSSRTVCSPPDATVAVPTPATATKATAPASSLRPTVVPRPRQRRHAPPNSMAADRIRRPGRPPIRPPRERSHPFARFTPPCPRIVRPMLWPLISLLATVAATLAIGWIADQALQRAASHSPDAPLWPLLRRCRIPLQLTVVSALLLAARPLQRIFHLRQDEGAHHLVLLFLLASLGWLTVRVVAAVLEALLSRYETRIDDPARRQRVHTQISVLRRVASAVVVVVTVAVMLLTFSAMRSIGAGLLASAGIIGIVAGIAAQSTLGNFFAGLQIAFGDTVRIGDTVVVDGQQGTVEEITLSYLVVRLWDYRRLIVPVSYFVNKPFENWTRRDPGLLAAVLLHLDHTTPVDELRATLRARLDRHPLWDGAEWALQVTDTTPSTIVVRATMTARTPDDAAQLRFDIREQLIAHLRDEHPHALPRLRTTDT